MIITLFLLMHPKVIFSFLAATPLNQLIFNLKPTVIPKSFPPIFIVWSQTAAPFMLPSIPKSIFVLISQLKIGVETGKIFLSLCKIHTLFQGCQTCGPRAGWPRPYTGHAHTQFSKGEKNHDISCDDGSLTSLPYLVGTSTIPLIARINWVDLAG